MAKRINYFLPYLRQGMTTLANHADVIGKRMAIPVKVNLEAVKSSDNSLLDSLEVDKEIVLFGPGDVLGINQNTISLIAPPPNNDNFETNLCPFIEFSEADFLWRFSSRKTADNKNWIPWLALVVLKSGTEENSEFEIPSNRNPDLPQHIQLKANAILPDLKESWRWAHVHSSDLQGSSTNQVVANVKNSPTNVVCRLIAARKLEPLTKYNAFLVPAYRIGAEAALGNSDSIDDRSLLSWETPAEGAGKLLPYYFDWEFRTGTDGDFENLVKKLKPRDLENMGTQTINCSEPGYGMSQEELLIEMEGALKSIDTKYQEWGMDSTDATHSSHTIQNELADLLNSRKQELSGIIKLRVTPPVYGEWYAAKEGEEVKVDTANGAQWLEEINLDFRHRTAAGLGVQFIKENQEELMKSAWDQLSKVKKVNKKLNVGRFGRELSKCMHKRLGGMQPQTLMKVALPLQHKIGKLQEGDNLEVKTIASLLKSNTVSINLTQLKVKKYLPGVGSRTAISNTSTQPPSPVFKPVFSNQLLNASFTMSGLANSVGTSPPVVEAPAPGNTNLFTQLGNQIKVSLKPENTIQTKFKNRFQNFRIWENEELHGVPADAIPEEENLDPLRPVIWYPEFHQPMYRFLRELSQDYILPGMENIQQNTVGLLQTNRRFIEAFMLGINHEFASELRWREFPTDMRGSFFRSFWDTSIYSLDPQEQKDFRETIIAAKLREKMIEKFGNDYSSMTKIEAAYVIGDPTEIEKAVAAAYEAAVEKWLLTREEDKDIDKLAHWKKNSRLGDHPAANNLNDEQENQSQIVLVVRGELLQKFSNTLIYLVPRKSDDPTKPDLLKASNRVFPIFEGALLPDIVFMGFNKTVEDVPDYFVIFEERMTDLRFGLDNTEDANEEELLELQENNFSWQHFQSVADDGYLNGVQPQIFPDRWNSAAYIAKVMLQKQVRVAVELKVLLSDEIDI